MRCIFNFTLTPISHDLRTPLARVLFYIEKLDTQQHTDLAQNIRRNLQEIEAVIKSTLEYARLENNISLHSVDINAWIQESLDLNQSPTHIKLNIYIEEQQNNCRIDPVLMRRAFNNLLNNAWQHAQSTVEVSLTLNKTHWHLSVADNGLGLPDQTLPSKQGLGLTITTAIVQMHAGKLLVEQSTLGGCKISLCWPVLCVF